MISKLLLIFAILISLPAIAPGIDTVSIAEARVTSDRGSQSVGSADDYVRNDSQFMSDFEVPLLGINVRNGTAKFGDRRRVPGVRIVEVSPAGPAAEAGLRNQHVVAQTALTIAFVAGTLIFPPAMAVVMMVSDGDIGESHDLIIAVDGERTRNIVEFDDAIRKAEPGESVYLVIAREGRRQQVRVDLPGQVPSPSTENNNISALHVIIDTGQLP